jgi:hypothetical protein
MLPPREFNRSGLFQRNAADSTLLSEGNNGVREGQGYEGVTALETDFPTFFESVLQIVIPPL